MKIFVYSALLLVSLAFTVIDGSLGVDQLPRAEDITWRSYNFKTVLTWGPKPVNHTYTVEFARFNGDRMRNPHCIRTTETVCDLTNELTELKSSHFAEVITEPLPGTDMDLIEPLYKRSEMFCPYNDTLIGRADFKIEVGEDKTKIRLVIQDPPTALYKDGRPLNIREIFMTDLKYKVAYNKAGSTGKKETISDLSELELSGLDKDESYCFSIAAYIPTRTTAKRLGEWSLPKCSKGKDKFFFDEYDLSVIIGGIVITLAFLFSVIALVVACCKRGEAEKKLEKNETASEV
ncbi:coagulation factor IIIb [Chanos chanos]|uniref:Tissue factor n=1 Tax=Chanos chanos TaxID=29144 RepID=A0A6J2VEC4_CHACN|nr:tissue factor-like [Chanos chanos]